MMAVGLGRTGQALNERLQIGSKKIGPVNFPVIAGSDVGCGELANRIDRDKPSGHRCGSFLTASYAWNPLASVTGKFTVPENS